MISFASKVVLLLQFYVLFIEGNTDGTLSTETVLPPPENCDRKAKNDDILYMHYVGKLDNGEQFDSSYTHTPKEPFGFKLGAGHVITGWEQGSVGMCVGETRRLTIPPSLGYGDEGYGDLIPPKSTLIFEIELVAIKDDDGTFEDSLTSKGDHKHASPRGFEHIDENSDNYISKEELVNFIDKLNLDAAENEKIDNADKTADDIIREHDLNQDGMISFEENQHFAEKQRETQSHDPTEPHHAFETIDLDNDKFITFEEMKNYLLSFYEGYKEDTGKLDIDQDVKGIFAEHDLDKDGRISEEENQHAADKAESEIQQGGHLDGDVQGDAGHGEL